MPFLHNCPCANDANAQFVIIRPAHESVLTRTTFDRHAQKAFKNRLTRGEARGSLRVLFQRVCQEFAASQDQNPRVAA